MPDDFPIHAVTALALMLSRKGVIEFGEFIGEMRRAGTAAPPEYQQAFASYAAALTRVAAKNPSL